MTFRSVILGIALFLPIAGISFLFLVFEGSPPTVSLIEIFPIISFIGICFILPVVLIVNTMDLIKHEGKKKTFNKIAKIFFIITLLSIFISFIILLMFLQMDRGIS